jgi:hypothetical protein
MGIGMRVSEDQICEEAAKGFGASDPDRTDVDRAAVLGRAFGVLARLADNLLDPTVEHGRMDFRS